MKSARVGVLSNGSFREHKLLFSAVGELYDVDFLPLDGQSLASFDAVVLLGASREEAAEYGRSGLRCLAFVNESVMAVPPFTNRVTLSRSAHLHQSFRACVLEDDTISKFSPIAPEPDDDILARLGAAPVWLRRQCGRTVIELAGVMPPIISPSEYLYVHFNESRWFSLLPLLHFAREVSGWVDPAPRACFMFDDPNLHWRSYGYIRYPEVIQQAKAFGYHVCFATIPLDGWYVHRATARLFRQNSEQVSLLIHGNDHTYLELCTTTNPVGLAVKAIQRVERIERETGVSFSRVMAAPHGGCSERSATALLDAGFEAACISRGSLMARNPGIHWPSLVGLQPAEFLGGGLPVLPRVAIRADLQTRLRCSMFLGQPLVLVGHHYDVRQGLDLLATIAGWAESLTGVRWTDIGAIARENYRTRRDRDILDVKMYSRKIRLEVPAEVTRLRVHRPWLREACQESLTLEDAFGTRVLGVGDPEVVLPVNPNMPLTIAAVSAQPAISPKVAVPRTRLLAFARRQLCEARDRFSPTMAPLLSRRGSGTVGKPTGTRPRE